MSDNALPAGVPVATGAVSAIVAAGHTVDINVSGCDAIEVDIVVTGGAPEEGIAFWWERKTPIGYIHAVDLGDNVSRFPTTQGFLTGKTSRYGVDNVDTDNTRAAAHIGGTGRIAWSRAGSTAVAFTYAITSG